MLIFSVANSENDLEIFSDMLNHDINHPNHDKFNNSNAPCHQLLKLLCSVLVLLYDATNDFPVCAQ